MCLIPLGHQICANRLSCRFVAPRASSFLCHATKHLKGIIKRTKENAPQDLSLRDALCFSEKVALRETSKSKHHSHSDIPSLLPLFPAMLIRRFAPHPTGSRAVRFTWLVNRRLRLRGLRSGGSFKSKCQRMLKRT